MLWFEKDLGSQRARITTFKYPSGAPYKSQKIHGSYPIFPGATTCIDSFKNRSISYEYPISVKANKPLLLGFVANVTQFDFTAAMLPGPFFRFKRVKQIFLQDEDDYCINHPLLKKTLSELGVSGRTPLERVLRIWKFVYSNMKYGSAIRPNTAPLLLQMKQIQGACGEFTRLTTALLRASGVHAREVHSLQFPDLGPGIFDHGWAECYTPPTPWYPVRSQRFAPEITDKSYKYNFRFRDYLVVYRGTNYKPRHRVIEKKNVISYGGIVGTGIFIPLDVSERKPAIDLLQEIAAGKKNDLLLFNKINTML
jgi:transglutaminase-like putative cysteine protease